jgi:hypothetical protein
LEPQQRDRQRNLERTRPHLGKQRQTRW